MADDFRITVEFADEGGILHFGRTLRERELQKELRDQLGDGVVVTRDGPHVFLYASTAAQARAAKQAVREALAHQEADASVSPVMRWHSDEDRWEDASAPLGQHAHHDEPEAPAGERVGYAEWEVRIDLPTHGDAVALAERLEAAGVSPIVRRWKYLLIGTTTDEDARALADRIRAEAPDGTKVTAEPSAAIGWELTGQNPFAPFGGFGPGPA